MAAPKTGGGSWASALKQPRSTASVPGSRQPSGTATPVSGGQAASPAPAAAAAGPGIPSETRPGSIPPKPSTPQQQSSATTTQSSAQQQPQASTSAEKPTDSVTAALNSGDYTRLLGCKLELTMNDDKKHQGHIYAFDSVMAILALSSQPCPQPGIAASYHILKSTEVKHIRVLSAADATTDSNNKPWRPPQVSLERVASNVEQAVKAEQQRKARLGKGVTPLAQSIFDALSKTLPTAWAGQNIQVLDDILIAGPVYDPSSVSFKPGALNPSNEQQQAKLQRLLKVLNGERTKILASQPHLANGNTAA